MSEWGTTRPPVDYVVRLRARAKARLDRCPVCHRPLAGSTYRAIGAAIGLPHSTLWTFLHGGPPSGRTSDLIEEWLAHDGE